MGGQNIEVEYWELGLRMSRMGASRLMMRKIGPLRLRMGSMEVSG